MKVLVVGSGGREHVLCWKLAQSKNVEKVFCAPGNAGIAQEFECVNIKVSELEELIAGMNTEKDVIFGVDPKEVDSWEPPDKYGTVHSASLQTVSFL